MIMIQIGEVEAAPRLQLFFSPVLSASAPLPSASDGGFPAACLVCDRSCSSNEARSASILLSKLERLFSRAVAVCSPLQETSRC